jgi:hypothetical protein
MIKERKEIFPKKVVSYEAQQNVGPVFKVRNDNLWDGFCTPGQTGIQHHFSPLKHEAHLNDIKKVSSYLKEKQCFLLTKISLVNAVLGSSDCLF